MIFGVVGECGTGVIIPLGSATVSSGGSSSWSFEGGVTRVAVTVELASDAESSYWLFLRWLSERTESARVLTVISESDWCSNDMTVGSVSRLPVSMTVVSTIGAGCETQEARTVAFAEGVRDRLRRCNEDDRGLSNFLCGVSVVPTFEGIAPMSAVGRANPDSGTVVKY